MMISKNKFILVLVIVLMTLQSGGPLSASVLMTMQCKDTSQSSQTCARVVLPGYSLINTRSVHHALACHCCHMNMPDCHHHASMMMPHESMVIANHQCTVTTSIKSAAQPIALTSQKWLLCASPILAPPSSYSYKPNDFTASSIYHVEDTASLPPNILCRIHGLRAPPAV